MGMFGNLFNSKSSVFKKFENLFSKVTKAQIFNRGADQRDAFLTSDILARREELTLGGKQALVLQYGKYGQVEFYLNKRTKLGKKTLPSLNEMWRAVQKVGEREGEEKPVGVPIKHLLASSSKVDIDRAKKQIRTATLYKVNVDLLHFKVSASESSKYKHHEVRIQLNGWEHQKKRIQGQSYQAATDNAIFGRISFDCDCGRHRYWYRYLTHLGGFGLDPVENIYPKIRNPRLSGCCCKHTIKAVATLVTPMVRMKLAKEMEVQAKEKGFLSKIFGEKGYVVDDEIKKASESSVDEITKEFSRYQAAQKGIKKKMSEKTAKELKTQRDTYRKEAKDLKSKNDQAERDKLLSDMTASMAISIYRDKMNRDDAIKKFAGDKKITIKDAQELSKQVNI